MKVANRYELLSEIGHGGMGRVWQARDTHLDRLVAVKEVLLPALPPAQQQIRLEQALREGRNAAAMADHPNIVTVYDVVVDAGSPWIVMQLVKGRSLHHALRDPDGTGTATAADQDGALQPLKPKQAALIAEAMLDALRAMHQAGIVHRDVKPHNILLADDGGILLTDFGIAKSDTDSTMTATGSVTGTLAYIAPERAEGEPGTPASDFFSLGVTLFETVEGYSPFAKNSATGTLTAILTKPLPTMTKAGRLAPLIKALTQKSPGKRPSHEQAAALLRGGGKTVTMTVAATAKNPTPPRVERPRPTPTPKAPSKPTPAPSSTSEPSSLLTGLGIAAVVAVVGGFIGVKYYQSHQKTAADHKACQELKAAEAEKTEARNALPDRLTSDQQSLMAKAWNHLETRLDAASAEAADSQLKSKLATAASDAGDVAQALASSNDATLRVYSDEQVYKNSYNQLLSPYKPHTLCADD